MKEYSGHSGSRQGRYKLKDRVRHYGEKLILLKPEYHAPELVISKKCLSGQIFSRNSAAFKELMITVQKAPLLLRESIVGAVEHAPTFPWPPTVDSLNTSGTIFPDILRMFLTTILSTNGKRIGKECIARHVCLFRERLRFCIFRLFF